MKYNTITLVLENKTISILTNILTLGYICNMKKVLTEYTVRTTSFGPC